MSGLPFKEKYKCITVMCPNLKLNKVYEVNELSGEFIDENGKVQNILDYGNLFE